MTGSCHDRTTGTDQRRRFVLVADIAAAELLRNWHTERFVGHLRALDRERTLALAEGLTGREARARGCLIFEELNSAIPARSRTRNPRRRFMQCGVRLLRRIPRFC
jgi:hypothetical protein